MFARGHAVRFVFAVISVVALFGILQAQPDFTANILVSSFMGADWVDAADIDGDGDIDFIGCAFEDDDVCWYENDGDMEFTEHIIHNDFNGAWYVELVDVDGDGDLDVLGAAEDGDMVAWWDNNGSEVFTYHLLDSEMDGAQMITAFQYDGDDDLDLLACAKNTDTIKIYVNDGDENFTPLVVTDAHTGVRFAWYGDVDGDDDLDIIGAGGTSPNGIISWYENDGEGGFTETIIDQNNSLDQKTTKTVDLDGDGDIDIIAANYTAGEAQWYENDGEANFTEHSIATGVTGAYGIDAADLDLDGDLDVIAAAWDGDFAIWWEGGEEEWVAHQIPGTLDGLRCVEAVDMDLDGDLDIMCAARRGNQIVWLESDLDSGWRPPNTFNLMSPRIGCTVTGTDTILVWQATTDPDDGDSLTHYMVWWATNSSFSENVDSAQVDTTCLTVSNLIDGSLYFWKVRACDTNTNGRWSAGVWTFWVEMVLPPYNLGAEIDSALGIVDLIWSRHASGGSGVDELSYDNGNVTGYYANGNGTLVGVKMSPTGPCDVIGLKYFTLPSGNDNTFNATVYNWDDGAPGTTELVSQTATSVNEGWIEVTLDTPVAVEGDFMAVMSMLSADVGIGYNAGANNDRAYFDTGGGWTAFGTTVMIRAIVDYGDEVLAEIGPDNELDEFIEFVVYRNGEEIGTATDSTLTDTMPTAGTYLYTVSAVYDIDDEEVIAEGLDSLTIDWDGGAVDDWDTGSLPTDFAIETIYPNPFNSTTSLVVALPSEGTLRLSVFNVLGQRVATLVNQPMHAGHHKISLQAASWTSGIYFVEATVGSMKAMEKIVLIK